MAHHGGAFPRNKQALKGWDKPEPATSREPIPVECFGVLAHELASRGKADADAAAAMVLAFDCYLEAKRGRLPGTMPTDRAVWGQSSLGPRGGAVGRGRQPPKRAAAQDGDLRRHGDRRRPSGPARPLGTLAGGGGEAPQRLFLCLTLGKLEVAMKESCAWLGFRKFVPHQLRHGGASHDALHRFRDARSIQRHGRWRARGSARRYDKTEFFCRSGGNSRNTHAVALKA